MIEIEYESKLREGIFETDIKMPKYLLKRNLVSIIVATSKPYIYFSAAMFIFTYIELVSFFDYFLYYTGGAILFLFTQRELQILVHDSSHFLFSSKRKINDRISNYLIAGFIGMNVVNYRRIHFKHHQFNGSHQDPEHIDYDLIDLEDGGLIMYVVKYVIGLKSIKLLTKYYFGDNLKKNINRDKEGTYLNVIMCQLIILLVLLFFTSNPILYLLWIYIALSWSPLLSSLRFLVEHPGHNDLTRSTVSWVLELPFFAPNNFNYHFEHHLWPGVPPYSLKAAHKYLNIKGYFKKYPEYLNDSFIKRLIGKD